MFRWSSVSFECCCLETSWNQFKPQETAISVNTIAFPSPSQLLSYSLSVITTKLFRSRDMAVPKAPKPQPSSKTNLSPWHQPQGVNCWRIHFYYWILLSCYCLIGMAEVQKCLPKWFPYLTWKWRFAWPIPPICDQSHLVSTDPSCRKARAAARVAGSHAWNPVTSSPLTQLWCFLDQPKDTKGSKRPQTGHNRTWMNVDQHLQNFGHGMVPSTIFPLCKCLKEASRRAASFSKHFIDSSKRYIGKFWLLFRMSEQLAVHQGLSYNLSSQNHQFFQYLLQDAFPNHPSSHPKRKVSGTLASLEQGWDVVLAQGGSANTAKQAQNGPKTNSL